MKVQDLDRSSFIDYISQVTLKNPKAPSSNLSVPSPTIPRVKESLFKGPPTVLSAE